jgi:formate hydrogenlyase transcriptional activator
MTDGERDCALFLLDADARIAVWYPGAEIIYQYKSDETVGWHMSIRGHGKRGAGEEEGNGDLQGFAVVVRDFSDLRQRHKQLRRGAGRAAPVESAIVGVVSGAFDRLPEANDAFLELVGHSRAELSAGKIEWSTLTPKKYQALDELAHEEALRFGASAPVRKELIRKDGTTVPVLVTTAILNLLPFRWVAFVTDLRERERLESAKGAPVLRESLQSTSEEDSDAADRSGRTN